MEHSLPFVVVAVITSGLRPALLRKLVESIAVQNGDGAEFTIGMVIVDNGNSSPNVSVENFPRLNVRVVREPVPGIPYARNRSVEAALEWGADYVAFIDDDEVATSDWIKSLLNASVTYSADMVAGKVDYDFAIEVAPWQRLGGFYDAPPFATGDVLPFARTTNLLVAKDALENIPEAPFNVQLQYTGGSDVAFTAKAVSQGKKIVWSSESLTVEHVPPDRCSPVWAVKRSVRVGNNIGRRLMEKNKFRGLAHVFLTGGARTAVGLSLTTAGLVLRHDAVLGRGVRIFARGFGMVTSPIWRYEEYKR